MFCDRVKQQFVFYFLMQTGVDVSSTCFIASYSIDVNVLTRSRLADRPDYVRACVVLKLLMYHVTKTPFSVEAVCKETGFRNHWSSLAFVSKRVAVMS